MNIIYFWILHRIYDMYLTVSSVVVQVKSSQFFISHKIYIIIFTQIIDV